MKIYTKTGDGGETGLFGGGRAMKSDARVHAYGELDELNSFIGAARLDPFDERVDDILATVQSRLFELGAELATVPGREGRLTIDRIDDGAIAELEHAIDEHETELEPLRSFILPGGCPAATRLHQARAVCRRAERSIVALSADGEVRGEVIRFVNRLGDLLFVLARLANLRANLPDVPWQSR